MPIPPLPPSHDLVRLIRPTLDETTFALLEHLKRRSVSWSYQKARTLSPFAFTRDAPLTALKAACDRARMPGVGRAANWDVVQLVHAAGAGRTVQCYGMEDGLLGLRHDLTIRVAADFYFVEHGQATVFWLQPRRTFGLTDTQLGMFGLLLRLALLRGNFAGADVELLDLAGPERGPRNPRTLRLADLPTVDEDTLTDGLERVADAYDAIKKMDIDWDALRRRGSKGDSPPPPPPADLFG
jgi:hypothetical protein